MSKNISGIPWGEDLERDCRELRKLESWGLYPQGHHLLYCPIDHNTPIQEEESNMLNVQTYVRKPFEVVATQVTEENIRLVAAWCGGELTTEDNETVFIAVKVHRPQTPRHGKAYVGDWVLESGQGKHKSYKVYLEKAFPKAFDLKAKQTNQTRRAVIDAVELLSVEGVNEPATEPVVVIEDKPEPAAVRQVETAVRPSATPSPAFLAALAKSKNAGRS